jgi:hypothetical protein
MSDGATRFLSERRAMCLPEGFALVGEQTTILSILSQARTLRMIACVSPKPSC